MKRKFIIGALALLITAGAAKAQHFTDAKFGIKGGWNSANITNNRDGDVEDETRLNTFNAGFVGVIPLGATFSLRTGLDLQSKGAKYTYSQTLGETSVKLNPLYLELPVNFAVMLPFNERVKAYVGAGPYASVGVGGKITTKLVGEEDSRSINWGNDDPLDSENQEGDPGDDFKRFDFGANIIGGVDFGKFGVQAQYGLGLTNTQPGNTNENNADKSNQHRVFSLSGIFYF